VSAPPLRVVRAASLEEARAAGWDELLESGDLYQSTRWLAVERELAAVPTTYLCAHRGTAVAAMSVGLLDRDAAPGSFGRIDRVLHRVAADRAPAIADGAEPLLERMLPTVACGGRRPGYSRLVLAGELDPAERARLAHRLLAEAEGWARVQSARSLSFLYVDESDDVLRDALRRAGFAEFASAESSRLLLPGPTFDDYLLRVSSSRRPKILYERRKLDEAGVEFRVRPFDEALVEELLPLELAVYRKYGNDFPEEEARRLHRAVARELGGDARIVTAEHDGAVRGFVVLLRFKDLVYCRQVGFDYDFQRRLPLYFGVVFYAAVDHALACGAAGIEYGVGSGEAKASRGCDVRRQYGYVKVLEGADHGAVRRLLDAVEAQPEAA
jgi:hypothetical protein